MERITQQTLGNPIVHRLIGKARFQTSIDVEVDILSGTATSEIKLAQYESMGAYQRAAAAELGVYGSYGATSVEASAKVEGAVAKALERNNVLGKQETFRPLYLIRLQGWAWPEQLFEDDVARVIAGTLTTNEFVRTYGTHVIAEVQVGGRLNVQVQMSSCLSSAERQKAIEAKVCASTETPVAGGGGCAAASYDDAEQQKIENSIENWDVTVEGGDPSTCATKNDCDGRGWLQSVTVDNDLQVLSVQLREMTEYIQEEHREAMRNKLKDYLEEVALQKSAAQVTQAPDANLCGSGGGDDPIADEVSAANQSIVSLAALAMLALASVLMVPAF